MSTPQQHDPQLFAFHPVTGELVRVRIKPQQPAQRPVNRPAQRPAQQSQRPASKPRPKSQTVSVTQEATFEQDIQERMRAAGQFVARKSREIEQEEPEPGTMPSRIPQFPIAKNLVYRLIYGVIGILIIFNIIAYWPSISGIFVHPTSKQSGNTIPAYETTAVIGYANDSAAHPTIFIAENVGGHILIFELPGGDLSKAIVFGGPTIYGSDKNTMQVTITIETDTNGKPLMIVSAGGNDVPFTYAGNGKFVPSGN